MRRPGQPRRQGFTLIEVLVSIAVFAVILGLILNFWTQNQRMATDQQARTAALTDARSAMARVTETLSQAAYIYPAGQTLQLRDPSGNRLITTGNAALAMLLPDDAVPCVTSDTCRYYGVLYLLDSRTRYTDQLPSNPRLPTLLVEVRTPTSFAWPPATLPSLDWRASGTVTAGVQAEGLVTADTVLMGTDSGFAGMAGVDTTVFSGGLVKPGFTPSLTQPDALINKVSYRITVTPTNGRGKPIVLDGSATARNVPRAN